MLHFTLCPFSSFYLLSTSTSSPSPTLYSLPIFIFYSILPLLFSLYFILFLFVSYHYSLPFGYLYPSVCRSVTLSYNSVLESWPTVPAHVGGGREGWVEMSVAAVAVRTVYKTDRDYLTLTHPLQRISSHSHGHLYNTHTPFHSIQFNSVHHFPPFTIFLPSLLPSLYTSLPSSIFSSSPPLPSTPLSSLLSLLFSSLFSTRKIITIFLLHCLYSLRVGEASLVTSNPIITHKYGFLFAYFWSKYSPIF